MRTYFRTLALLLPVCLLLASTCKKDDSAGLTNVELNTPVELGIHEKVSLKGRNLAFEITEIADSRCPADVQCVWAGAAQVKLNISGSDTGTVLNLCIGQCESRYREADTVVIQHQQEEYSLILSQVKPYPGTGNQKKTAVFTLKKD